MQVTVFIDLAAFAKFELDEYFYLLMNTGFLFYQGI